MSGLTANADAFLAREAVLLHQAVFGFAAPKEVVSQYVDAVSRHPDDARVAVDMVRIADLLLDAEAIEIALRLRSRQNSLTRKFHVMCYLCETRPEYYRRFVCEDTRFVRGFLSLAFHTFRTAYKLLKGRYLLWKYDVLG